MNLTEQQASEMERKMRAEIASGSGEHAQQVGVCDRWLREHGSDPLVKLWPDPVKVDISMKPIKAPKPRMNKWETEYAQELESHKRAGLIRAWWFESIKFRLADSCWYTPDFAVLLAGPGRVVQIHEVKGVWRDDALVKFKVTAEQFPFTFLAVSKRKVREGGGWEVIRCIQRGEETTQGAWYL